MHGKSKHSLYSSQSTLYYLDKRKCILYEDNGDISFKCINISGSGSGDFEYWYAWKVKVFIIKLSISYLENVFS